MIWVLELWHFQPVDGELTAIMQEMDDLLGPAAHVHPGWCGHARFFARLDGSGETPAAGPSRGMMLYPWRSRELHEDLVRDEEPKLLDFYAKYCTREREIHYYAELAVDVDDHDDEAP